MDNGAFIKRKRIEKGYTQLQLAEKASMDERSVRRIENSEINGGKKSLKKILDVLDISSSDKQKILNCHVTPIDDDPAIIYEKMIEENKENPLFINNQVFSPENIVYMRNLLQHVGVTCDISSYGRFKTASVKNDYELSSIQLDLNLRVLHLGNKSIFHIINFYVNVNRALLSETVIKDALIKALEICTKVKIH
jgi:transcriptional regulator with XRE-family HTH domain